MRTETYIQIIKMFEMMSKYLVSNLIYIYNAGLILRQPVKIQVIYKITLNK